MSALAAAPDDPPSPDQRTRQRMLDQLRLDELLGEAEKLRHALAALGSRDGAASPSASAAPRR